MLLSNVRDISNLETLVNKKCPHVTLSNQVTNAYIILNFLTKCIYIKRFESLKLIKTIIVCINQLKFHITPTHRARFPTYVSSITNSQFIVIIFASVA